MSRSSRTGELDFGPEAVVDTLENLVGHNVPLDLSLRWFDYWLKGIDNGIYGKRSADPDLRHGSQRVAKRERVAAGSNAFYRVLPSQQRKRELARRGRRPTTTAPGGEPPDRLRTIRNPVERGGNFS